jgi:hypothetical protein
VSLRKENKTVLDYTKVIFHHLPETAKENEVNLTQKAAIQGRFDFITS